MEGVDRPRGNNEEIDQWRDVLPHLEFAEPSDDRASIIYRFLLTILSTLNEQSRNALQNDINRVFGWRNGVVHVLMNNANIDGSILEAKGTLDSIFLCLNRPLADTHHDLLPPADTELPTPFDDFTDELIFLPNRVHVICKFLEELVSTYNNHQVLSSTKHKIYFIFGRPINVNKSVNVSTIQNIVSKIVEGLNTELT